MYGGGDGSTSFNLPDYRGRTLVGLDPTQAEFEAPGRSGGERTHQLTVAEIPSHRHTLSFGDINQTITGYYALAGMTHYSYDGSGWAGFSGGDQPHTNMPPYRVALMIIKY